MVVSKIFIFTPKIGEVIQFDEHIFQMGWFNHQLGGYIGNFGTIYPLQVGCTPPLPNTLVLGFPALGCKSTVFVPKAVRGRTQNLERRDAAIEAGE